MLTFLLAVLSLAVGALGVEICRLDQGGGVCPDENTCCPLGEFGSGCIPNDLGAFNATCCSDNATGCAVGYTCGPLQKCFATHAVHDPLVQVLPRYILCQPPHDTLTKVHGLWVGARTGNGHGALAYYSTHGDLQREMTPRPNIIMAVVMVHGAGRNADDYFCSATAAAKLQTKYDFESVLVVAPRFLVPSDGPMRLTSGGTPMCWNDTGSGPWRYGANAISPPLATNISSFDAMDQLIRVLNNPHTFPNLKHISIAGHSSGGQFVQRWSLLTPSFWGTNGTIQMKGVVANPSSYAYLTDLRWQNGAWQKPSTTSCSQYNVWEWGLNRGNGELHAPYKDWALEQVGNSVSRLSARFKTRTVLYLAGSLDRCNVSTSDGWCNSHGLEITCMDELQGSNRWERNLNYVASLKQLGITSHKRIVVEGVGHDHSLIFTSPQGIQALFGSINDDDDKEIAAMTLEERMWLGFVWLTRFLSC